MSEHRIIFTSIVNLTPIKAAIASPCVGICELDDFSICIGCKRSSEMIAHWSSYSDAERASIMAALDEISFAN